MEIMFRGLINRMINMTACPARAMILSKRATLALVFLVLIGALLAYLGATMYYSARINELDELLNKSRAASAPMIKLNNAISRAKEFYVNEYLLRSLSAVERGKVSVLFSKDGKTSEVSADYIPTQEEKVEVFNKYVEYQLYIVVHFLMYFQDWGYSINDPLVERAKEWLISTINEEGRWVWSEQGCLHSKAIIALIGLGEKEMAKKAMNWAFKSNLKTKNGFAEYQTDTVIHSVSKNVLTYLHVEDVVHRKYDSFKFSREGTAKFLYAMAALNMTDTAEFQNIKNQLEISLSESIPLSSFVKNFGDVTAISWVIYAYEKYNLPKDSLYNKAKVIIIALTEKDLSENILMNYSRGKMLMALSLMDDQKIYTMRENLLTIILDKQFSDGHWEQNGSIKNNQPEDWDASQLYDNGFILNYKGGQGSTTKTILEALIIFRNNALNLSSVNIDR